jgi:hypothetical protein
MSSGTRDACLDALVDLVDSARGHRDAHEAAHKIGTAQTFDNLAKHLDAVRTTLIEEGDDYLDVAWAFVDAGRLTIARHLVRLARGRVG